MLKAIIFSALFLTACQQSTVGPAQVSSTPPVENPLSAQKSVVRIFSDYENERGTGTGFVVGPNLVLTNSHVVRSRSAEIYVWDHGSEFPSQAKVVIAFDPHLDLALVYAVGLTAPPAKFALIEPKQLSAVTAVGFPFSTDQMFGRLTSQASLTEGKITAVDTGSINDLGKVRLLNHTTTLNPGNSGGPLVNGCGQVVGINTLKGSPSKVSNVSISTTSLEAVAFLLANGVQPELASTICETQPDEGCSSDLKDVRPLATSAKFVELHDYLRDHRNICKKSMDQLESDVADAVKALVQKQVAVAGRWRLGADTCSKQVRIIPSGLSILAVSSDDAQFETVASISDSLLETNAEVAGAPARYTYGSNKDQLTLRNETSNQQWELERCSG